MPEMSTERHGVSERIELNTKKFRLMILVLVIDCQEEGGVNIWYREQKYLNYGEFQSD